MSKKAIKVKLVRSPIGHPKKHKAVLEGMGLRRLNRTVTLEDTPAIRGMVRKVCHLVEIQE
jgi:large subunit ribosomal protein L30